jgi:hypothetical protein
VPCCSFHVSQPILCLLVEILDRRVKYRFGDVPELKLNVSILKADTSLLFVVLTFLAVDSGLSERISRFLANTSQGSELTVLLDQFTGGETHSTTSDANATTRCATHRLM